VPPEDELFADLIVSGKGPSSRLPVWLSMSFVVHAAIITLVVLLPILWPSPLPEQRDYVRALLYDPPPPPPPPLPKGSGMQAKAAPSRPTPPEPVLPKPSLVAPIEAPPKSETPPDAGALDSDRLGSPTGSDFGVPEGMEGGVEGGVVGGVPGGVLGGVVGGTGDIPVPVHDYDRPPRLIRQTKPQYPQEAFVKKIEGVVLVEILIDATGRVARVRVVQSVPLLDAAALAAVRSWAFEPAIKHGRLVATVALAPVTFRIF